MILMYARIWSESSGPCHNEVVFSKCSKKEECPQEHGHDLVLSRLYQNGQYLTMWKVGKEMFGYYNSKHKKTYQDKEKLQKLSYYIAIACTSFKKPFVTDALQHFENSVNILQELYNNKQLSNINDFRCTLVAYMLFIIGLPERMTNTSKLNLCNVLFKQLENIGIDDDFAIQAKLYFGYGECLLKERCYVEAEKKFGQAIESSVTNNFNAGSKHYFHYSFCLSQNGKLEESEKNFDKASSLLYDEKKQTPWTEIAPQLLSQWINGQINKEKIVTNDKIQYCPGYVEHIEIKIQTNVTIIRNATANIVFTRNDIDHYNRTKTIMTKNLRTHVNTKEVITRFDMSFDINLEELGYSLYPMNINNNNNNNCLVTRCKNNGLNNCGSFNVTHMHGIMKRGMSNKLFYYYLMYSMCIEYWSSNNPPNCCSARNNFGIWINCDRDDAYDGIHDSSISSLSLHSSQLSQSSPLFDTIIDKKSISNLKKNRGHKKLPENFDNIDDTNINDDIIIVSGMFQKHYKHKVNDGRDRINLTFRNQT